MVYLIGAGPGDPDLITVKGRDLLRRAEVVLYDRLANPALLAEVPADAVRIDVGKKPNDPQQAKQDWINELLVEHGRTGKTVVRLKGGDPFVFGRGREEGLALEAAGIPWETVPGVSASIAGPGAAGIPVTHRGIAECFGVFTAHRADDPAKDGVPWAAAAALATSVFLMGVERLPQVVAGLLEHGKPPETPVAVVVRATWPDQRTYTGTLETIVERAKNAEAPAVIVVGDVSQFANV